MNWTLFANSLLLAGIATLLAMGFGLAAALWLSGLETRWRNTFFAFALVALALPSFLVTNSWIDLLGERGMLRAWLPFRIYSLGGTVWILSLMLWPVTLLAVASAWRRLEPAQFECDPALRGIALMRWLLFPAARGELILAAILTFVLALNNFAVPAILQTRVLPDELWVQFNTTFFQKPGGGFDFARMLSLSLPLVLAPFLLLMMFLKQGVSWPRIRGGISPRTFRRQLGPKWQITSGIVTMFVCAISVVLPLAQIVATRRTWTELPGAIEAGAGAAWNSFWFAALASTAVVFVTLALTGSRRLRWLASTGSRLAWLLFFIPGVLIGIGLIHLFNRPGLIGFYQSIGIVVLAFVLRYFAFGWAAVRHAFESVDSDLSDVARLEGATRWQKLRHVIWPQIAPQVLAAWYVVYLLCLWDVESIVIIQPPGGETLALKIFNLLHYGYAAQVNALCLTLLGLALLPLMVWTLISWARDISKINHRSSLAWGLVLGFCFLCAGCSPKSSQSANLDSRLFERAMVIGHRGVGIGEFNKTRSVAVDREDNVYAVDMTGRVQKFSPDGKYLLSWQMPQTDLGKPKGMACDHDGNIMVIEPHYQRVNHFTPDGRLVAQWGCRGTNEGCFMLPRGIAENSRGEFFVCEYMGAERVQRFALNVQSPKSKVQGQSIDQAQGESSATNWPYRKLDTPLATRSPQPDTGRSEATLLQVIGQAGTAPGEFNRAEGICTDAQDRLYVADSCNHRIQIFSPDGKFLREFGKPGSQLGELSYPYDVAVDKTGNIFVCEFGNSRIQVFDANCQPIELIGGAGAEPGRFNNPWSIALDSHGNLYVADALNHRLQKLVRRLHVVGKITSRMAAKSTDLRLTSAAAN